ncbi:hypothetical protein EUAN_12510 [Andreesenia angusta]|uniref:Uncharacterized protein n=1 Tax=Andreesenia angusta TaxID=39480 RepID=A0A1S1V6M2_9FIRM|nr:hypothetical protein EUAN_12510 [Andreesenia angusta]
MSVAKVLGLIRNIDLYEIAVSIGLLTYSILLIRGEYLLSVRALLWLVVLLLSSIRSELASQRKSKDIIINLK